MYISCSKRGYNTSGFHEHLPPGPDRGASYAAGDEEADIIRSHLLSGLTAPQIASHLNVSLRTVYRR